jgi:hypothetical protein
MKRRIIALSGVAGSGKDTVAGFLSEICETTLIAFADPLKEFCQELFDFTDDQIYGPSECRNAPDPRYVRKCDYALHQADGYEPDPCCPACGGKPVYLTPRFALQTLGTEWGRNCCEDIWARYGVRKAIEAFEDGYLAVVTDCRFINEARAVREAGGEVWQIIRPGAGLKGAAGQHPSETEQTTLEFRRHVTSFVDNNGTVEDLRAIVGLTYAYGGRAGFL